MADNRSHEGEGSLMANSNGNTQAEMAWWNNRAGQLDPYTGQPYPTWDEIQTAVEALKTFGLPQEQFDLYLSLVTGNPSMWRVNLEEARRAGAYYQDQAKEQQRQGYLDQAVTDIQGLRDKYLPEYDQQIAKFADPNTGMVRNDFLYTDPTYGNAFSQAQGAINNQINQVRSNAALSNANAGVRASGKTNDMVQQSEQTAAANRGNLFAGLFGQAEGELQGYKEARRNYDTQTTQAMDQARLGWMPSIDNINAIGLQNSPQYAAGQMTGADFHAMSTGELLAYLGLGTQVATGIAGGTQNAIDSFTGMLPGRR
jgi:hypothetical protein